MARAKGQNRTLQSRAERYRLGKALRSRVSRESHADYVVTDKRDPVAILSKTDATRIPELLPIRYQHMAVSPFTFLRGAAAVMAADLAQMPQLGATVQACGDCHLMNFGAFETPEDQVLFDINDFDETLPGVDFTADIKRLVASVAVAAVDAGMAKKRARSLAMSTAQAYREFIGQLAKLTPMEVWHTQMDLEREVKRFDDVKLRSQILDMLRKAKRDLAADDNFPHLASTEGGAHIEDRPPTIYHLKGAADARHTIDARSAFSAYRETLTPDRRVLLDRYALCDLAFKVVGVGSVGTFCAVGLFVTLDGEPMFLQVKEAQASVLERIGKRMAKIGHQGKRVIEGQRIMQAASDIFLGWTEDEKTGRFFYVRHLKNRHLGSIGEVIEGNALSVYATLCGRTLARAHARSGDPAALAGYMGRSEALDDALASFALAYAEQTKRDHARLTAWLGGKGRKKP